MFGSQGAETAAAVTTTVQQVLGTADPALAQAALANTDRAAALAVELAKIAAAREASGDTSWQADLMGRLGDVQDARRQTITLSASHSPIAWGAPIVSAVIILIFGVMLTLVLTRGMPAGSEPLANVMLGTLSAMVTAVANYWLGSSSGSARKSEDLSQARNQLANSIPITRSIIH